MSKSMGLMISAVASMKTYLVTDYKYLEDIISQKPGWGKNYPHLGTYVFRKCNFTQIVNNAFLQCEEFSEKGCLWVFVTDEESNSLVITGKQRQLAKSHQWKIINIHVGCNTVRENNRGILVASDITRLKGTFTAIELFRTTDKSSVNDYDVASFLSQGKNIQFIQYSCKENGARFSPENINLPAQNKVKSILGIVSIGCSLSVEDFDQIACSINDMFSSVENSCIGITIDSTIMEGWRLSLATSDNII